MDSEKSTPYRDLWFDDGNLVIQTGPALFRVHKSLLSLHASVFRDMASLPVPESLETYEGVQLVTLLDDTQDMHHFLRALYHPDYFLPPPERTTFAVLEGVLRLAHKYDAPAFRRRALRHIARACVTDVMELKDETDLDRSYPMPPGDRVAMIMAEIALAREVQALWALPTLFLSAGLLDRHDLTSSPFWRGKQRSLALEDAVASLSVHKVVMQSDILCLFLAHCDSGVKSCRKRATLLAPNDFKDIRLSPLTAFDDWIRTTNELCDACHAALRRSYSQEKERIWALIPDAAGLPPWDELLKLKDCDISNSSDTAP